MENSHNIFWVASYPKSGNTWMRNILARLLFNATSFAESLYYIQDIYGIQDKQTLLTLPKTSIQGIESSLLKIHCQFSDLPSEYLGISLKTIGFIYIYRHPLDVLLSAINYWRLDPNSEQFFEAGRVQTPDELLAAGAINIYLEKFSQSLSIETWLEMAGRWDQNVFSWINAAPNYPLSAIINYNHLIDHPLRELEKLYPIFPSFKLNQLSDALDYQQQVTQYNSKLDNPYLQSFKEIFFWKRTKDTYQHYFSPSAIQNFYQHHHGLLEKLNL